jgi:hypothetical protein
MLQDKKTQHNLREKDGELPALAMAEPTFLGELSAATYAIYPPPIQAAFREMVKLGEITIEGMPELEADVNDHTLQPGSNTGAE